MQVPRRQSENSEWKQSRKTGSGVGDLPGMWVVVEAVDVKG